MRRHLELDVFSPRKNWNIPSFPRRGACKFHNTYDELRYQEMLQHVISLDIPEDVWPYRDIEEDFYHFNSQGYRTYEWVNVASKYDLTIGCCCVEGVGVRKQEHWTTLYEQNTNRQLVNLGKAGVGASYIHHTLMAWLQHPPVELPMPERVFIFWPEPSIHSVLREDDSWALLNYGNQRIHPEHFSSDQVYNIEYQQVLSSPVVYSNNFLMHFLSTHMMLRATNSKVYNIFPSTSWKPEDVSHIENITNVPCVYVSLNNTEGGWGKFQDYQYFPGADATHHGWQHQYPLYKSIILFCNL